MWVQDGFCDDQNNNVDCKFDGGDCCNNNNTSYDKYCERCIECKISNFGEFVKKPQCKKATRVCKLNHFSDKTQRWKLDSNTGKLENKEGVWKSDGDWEFKPQINGLIYIENTSKTKVLGSTSDGKVIEEVKVEGKAEQLWKKGEPDAEGYFTLQNSGEPKVLTAISESSLEIKGIR